MYIDYIIKKAPVVISQIDRDRHSVTYGSCDRNHWHLKIRDFTSAILQQSGLTLCLLYQVKFPGNIYYHNNNVRDWAEATVRYWADIQLSDGSYNEYYPWEHGFPPTAFSLYSACEVYKRLGMNDKNIEFKISRTAKFLSKNIEDKALNQEIASVAGMYSAYTILHKEWILEALDRKLTRILSLQNEEGWFPEYGGADIGYLSVAFDMLAEYYWMSKDDRVIRPLEKALNFLSHFIHEDATAGGEYGSRNTNYFLPNGSEVMSCLGYSAAESILDRLFENSSHDNYFMDSVDDRYLSHYILHSVLRALEKRLGNTHPVKTLLPDQKKNITSFRESGLISFRMDSYSGVIALYKGGIVKIFSEGKECFVDCGYRVDFGNGIVAATNWQDLSYKTLYNAPAFEVSGRMNFIKLKVSTPFLHIGLRAAAVLFGNRIINYLKQKMIFNDKHTDIVFSRKIELCNNKVIITDSIESPEEIIIENANNMSLRHVASGKFFMPSDLISRAANPTGPVKHLKRRIVVNIINGESVVEEA